MPEASEEETKRAVIERFYDEVWNEWNLAAGETVSEDLRFRSSLGTTLEGLHDFKDYVETIRTAFPAWYNRIDELILSSDNLLTHITIRGRTP